MTRTANMTANIGRTPMSAVLIQGRLARACMQGAGRPAAGPGPGGAGTTASREHIDSRRGARVHKYKLVQLVNAKYNKRGSPEKAPRLVGANA